MAGASYGFATRRVNRRSDIGRCRLSNTEVKTPGNLWILSCLIDMLLQFLQLCAANATAICANAARAKSARQSRDRRRRQRQVEIAPQGLQALGPHHGV